MTDDEETPDPEEGDTIGGHSPSEEALEKVTVQVKREHVFFFLAGLAAAIGIGALVWKGAEFYFQSQRYNQIADRVIEGIGALENVAESLEK